MEVPWERHSKNRVSTEKLVLGVTGHKARLHYPQASKQKQN